MHFIILMGYKWHTRIYIYIYIYIYVGISLLLDKAVSETFFSMRNLWESNPRSSTLGRFGVPNDVAMVIILHLQPSCYPHGAPAEAHREGLLEGLLGVHGGEDEEGSPSREGCGTRPQDVQGHDDAAGWRWADRGVRLSLGHLHHAVQRHLPLGNAGLVDLPVPVPCGRHLGGQPGGRPRGRCPDEPHWVDPLDLRGGSSPTCTPSARRWGKP